MIQVKWQTKIGKKIVSREIPDQFKNIVNVIRHEIAKEVSTMKEVTIIWQLENKRFGLAGKASCDYNWKTGEISSLKVHLFDYHLNSQHHAYCVLAHEFGHIKDYLMGNFKLTFRQAEISADAFGIKIVPDDYLKSDESKYSTRMSKVGKYAKSQKR